MTRIIGTLAVFVALACATAPAQKQRTTVRRSASNSGCVSGTFSFKCPKGYKVLLTGKTADRLFFANNPKFRYGVFVVSEPDESTVGDVLPKIVRAFLPNHNEKFEWKDVEADERRSSSFEVESKRRIGLGNAVYLTFEHRVIDFNGKKLLTGTIVDGYEGPVGIRESFEKGEYTTNGGCFDSVDIIAAFTKEKLDHEKGPCFFMITMSPGI